MPRLDALNLQKTPPHATDPARDTCSRISHIATAGQSTWAVDMLPAAARVCVSLAGSERITNVRALRENGGERALAAPGSLATLDMIVVNFD